MAKAYATCVCKTCGKQWDKIVFAGNRNDADRKAEWAARTFDECPDCEAARKARENSEAAQKASEAGWPTLTGSEKQVSWAESIRLKVHAALTEEIASVPEEAQRGKWDDDGVIREYTATEFIGWLIASHNKASWWIDRRNDTRMASISADCRDEFAGYLRSRIAQETAEETAVREDAEAEMTIAPQNQTRPGAADITVTDAEVTARYDRDDDFRAVVKSLGYAWDSTRRIWSKPISIMTGAAAERAAELGNRLLNAGFAVRIADAATRAAAVNGDYAPEHRRWITYLAGGERKGWFAVTFPREDGLYDAARKIRGSKYQRPSVVVPPDSWQELLDFARCYDFRLSPKAEAAIEAAKAAVIIVAPAPAKAAAYHEQSPADILASRADVLSDLLDE